MQGVKAANYKRGKLVIQCGQNKGRGRGVAAYVDGGEWTLDFRRWDQELGLTSRKQESAEGCDQDSVSSGILIWLDLISFLKVRAGNGEQPIKRLQNWSMQKASII